MDLRAFDILRAAAGPAVRASAPHQAAAGGGHAERHLLRVAVLICLVRAEAAGRCKERESERRHSAAHVSPDTELTLRTGTVGRYGEPPLPSVRAGTIISATYEITLVAITDSM